MTTSRPARGRTLAASATTIALAAGLSGCGASPDTRPGPAPVTSMAISVPADQTLEADSLHPGAPILTWSSGQDTKTRCTAGMMVDPVSDIERAGPPKYLMVAKSCARDRDTVAMIYRKNLDDHLSRTITLGVVDYRTGGEDWALVTLDYVALQDVPINPEPGGGIVELSPDTASSTDIETRNAPMCWVSADPGFPICGDAASMEFVNEDTAVCVRTQSHPRGVVPAETIGSLAYLRVDAPQVPPIGPVVSTADGKVCAVIVGEELAARDLVVAV